MGGRGSRNFAELMRRMAVFQRTLFNQAECRLLANVGRMMDDGDTQRTFNSRSTTLIIMLVIIKMVMKTK